MASAPRQRSRLCQCRPKAANANAINNLWPDSDSGQCRLFVVLQLISAFMNPRPDTLHSLIKTLKPEETVGFESSLSAYRLKGRKNLSLVLFQSMKAMERYDYDELVISLRNKIPADTVSSVKSQVKKRLVAYLRENADTELRTWHQMLEEADMLIRRGIYPDAHKLLLQVNDMARRANKPYYAIAALHMAGNILQQVKEAELVTETFALGEELGKLAADTQLTMTVYSYYTTNVAINLRNSLVRDEASRKILGQLDLIESDVIANSPLSVYQEYFYLMGKYVNARLKADFGTMHEYAKRRVVFLDRELSYLKAYQPHSIPIIYLNLVESSLIVNSRTEWEEALSAYKSYIDKFYPGIAIYHGFYDYERYTFPVKNSTDVAEISNALAELEQSYGNLPDGIVMFKKLYEMTLGGGFHKVREFDKAFHFFQKLIHEEHSSQVGDGVDDVARLMILISEFDRMVSEGCPKELLIGFRAQVVSAYHHFRKKKGADFRLELGFIDVFRSFAKDGNLNDLAAPLALFKANVTSWLDSGISYVRQFNMSFDILAWLGKKEEEIHTSQANTFSKGPKRKVNKK